MGQGGGRTYESAVPIIRLRSDLSKDDNRCQNILSEIMKFAHIRYSPPPAAADTTPSLLLSDHLSAFLFHILPPASPPLFTPLLSRRTLNCTLPTALPQLSPKLVLAWEGFELI